jgi:hypothetical protein
MQQRRRFTQVIPLRARLIEEARRLREEARGTPPGIAREQLLRRARQAETATQIERWLSSSELRPPS